MCLNPLSFFLYLAAVPVSFEDTSNGNDRIHIFECTGTESSLKDCPRNVLRRIYDFCSHVYDAGVICQGHYG